MPVNELPRHSGCNVTFLVHKLCAPGVVLFSILHTSNSHICIKLTMARQVQTYALQQKPTFFEQVAANSSQFASFNKMPDSIPIELILIHTFCRCANLWAWALN